MSNAIKLQSMEGEIFDVDIRIAKMSGTIKTILEDSGADGNDDTVIPLPNVKSNILRKILQWSQFHKDDPSVTEPDGKKEKRTDDISLWDAEFLNVDQSILLDLILAAKYLEIKGLIDITYKSVANILKGKTPDEIRKTFAIPNDFTAVEEEQVRLENEWCEEKAETPPPPDKIK